MAISEQLTMPRSATINWSSNGPLCPSVVNCTKIVSSSDLHVGSFHIVTHMFQNSSYFPYLKYKDLCLIQIKSLTSMHTLP